MAEKKTVTVTNQAGTKVEVSKERAEVLERRAAAFNETQQKSGTKSK